MSVPGVRSVLAPNPGPFTFDGTRSYVVGEGGAAAVVDPGPAADAHVAALARAASGPRQAAGPLPSPAGPAPHRPAAAAEGSRQVVILLTHAHADHAAGASALARLLGGVRVIGPGGSAPLADGDVFETSAGALVAVSTPGHAERHFCFHLQGTGVVFTGDLVLGEGDTTWIGEYPGAVSDYLESLNRLEALAPRVLLPGHGGPVYRPAEAVARFRRHRLERIEQVRRALGAGAGADPEGLAARVYGELPEDVFAMACKTVQAILDHIATAE